MVQRTKARFYIQAHFVVVDLFFAMASSTALSCFSSSSLLLDWDFLAVDEAGFAVCGLCTALVD